jgi:hypothetical protein
LVFIPKKKMFRIPGIMASPVRIEYVTALEQARDVYDKIVVLCVVRSPATHHYSERRLYLQQIAPLELTAKHLAHLTDASYGPLLIN